MKSAPSAPRRTRYSLSVIWHYTTGTGLIGILQSQSIWASSLRHLNDSSELVYGREAFAAAIGDVIVQRGGAHTWHEFEHDDGRTESYPEPTEWYPLDLVRQQLLGSVPWESEFARVEDMYAASFSTRGDLLSQWRGYAGRGGFAIGFSQRVLKRALAGRADGVRVRYGPAARRELVGVLNDLIDEWGRPPSDDELLRLMPRAAGFKDPAFSEEREVRFVVRDSASQSVQLRDVAGILVPYVPLEFPRNALRHIRMGPGRDRRLHKLSLEAALKSYGYDHSVDITASDVPYRSS